MAFQPEWARRAQTEMAKIDVEMERINPRWQRMSFSTKAYFLHNAKRCYDEDPVQFKHFEAVVMALVSAKLTS